MGPALRGWQFLAACLIIAGIAWVAAPGAPPSAKLSREGDPWQLPKPPQSPPPAIADALARAGLWGKLADAPAPGTVKDPAWRFVGVARAGDERFVLVQVEGQPERRLTVNDALPDGSKILQINDEALCILVNGMKRKLPLYGTGRHLT